MPEFVPEIPLVKLAFANNAFRYYANEDGASLLYVAHPPFGRPTYRFELNKWVYVD